VTGLPAAVHDKCLVAQECFACHLLLPTPVWVARAQMVALWLLLLPDLWMCHLLWLNTQKLSILDTVFFFLSKNAVRYILYAHGVEIQHQCISAGNTNWVYTKCMLFRWPYCALFIFSPVQRVRMHGALFLRPSRLWHGAVSPFIFLLHNHKQIMEGLFVYILFVTNCPFVP
jgi:hypothetical protein